ncbi:MAG: T9SS type A sorting domain-containing protein, partial [Tannerella sp.]|nr:T9SS type A sorting domain-containing protein [Tannerella sp.]
WLFAIRPKLSTLSADGTEYRQLVRIAYTMDKSVVKGEYEVKLNDVNLTLNDGQVIHQDEITAPVTVLTSVGNAAVDAGDVRYADGVLTVNTPVAERITVYSIGGAVMYQAQKAAGEATFDLRSLPKGVFIARGSSGWTKKIVVSG